jgi:hypothetical protein
VAETIRGPFREVTPQDGFPCEDLEDAVDIAIRGREIATAGVPYLVDGVIPAYGMLGFLVAFAKVGKTTFGMALAAHVAMGRTFLDRTTTAARVLVFAAEDPPEYTAWMARHLLPLVERGRMTFRCLPLRLGGVDLERVVATVQRERVGFVLIASWQAVVRGLIRDENDNAGAVCVVEEVKAAARKTGIPWLIDAHSGKGEDQDDDADPSKAMRGASSAAGAADYTLSLRYSNGTFGTHRRLSGKGRFVSFAPLSLDFDPSTSTYTVIGEAQEVAVATTWRLICETGALDAEPRSIAEIARLIGLVSADEGVTNTQRRQISAALRNRPEVAHEHGVRRGQKTSLYRRLDLT